MTRTAHRKPPPDHAVSWLFLRSFTGKERDEETGFGYFGARYMDHELMTMWLSVDPLADKYPNVSPYNYCLWNPVKLVDPDGNFPVSPHGIESFGLGGTKHQAASEAAQKEINKLIEAKLPQ